MVLRAMGTPTTTRTRVRRCAYGIYYDELAKVDGAWRFALRRLQPIFMDTGDLVGPAPISRAGLHEHDTGWSAAH
jgi:hypothetical protein